MSITETNTGVKVVMSDGSIEEGDIVLGCDGVHSTVRELMWQNANQTIPDFIKTQEKKCESSLCSHYGPWEVA